MYRLRLSLPYIAFIKAVYNESNERCNALQVYPRPLYASAAVNIRPLPIFFNFFSEFSRLAVLQYFVSTTRFIM